jgi:hypothetical protein
VVRACVREREVLSIKLNVRALHGCRPATLGDVYADVAIDLEEMLVRPKTAAHVDEDAGTHRRR